MSDTAERGCSIGAAHRVSALAALAVMVTGCASYAPAPLSDGSALVADPAAAVLADAAAAMRRPYLTPVAIDLARPLDGNAIATIAVINNPDLKAARVRAGVADAQVFQARLLPDPTLNLGQGTVLSGPDPFADLVAALALDLNALRTRGVQVARARASAQQVRLDFAWSEWQTAGQARIRATRTIALAELAGYAAGTRDSARSILGRTERAAGRGDLGGDALEAARIAAADAEDKARVTERDLAVARGELGTLLGLPATALKLAPPPELAPGPQPADITLDPARLYAIAVANRTDLAALRAGYASQEATVRKAILDQFPTLNLTINNNRDTSGNEILGPALDLTLPLWNRNRGGIAVERATRAALGAEYDARLAQTRAEITAAVEGISVARRQRDAAVKALPATRRFAEASARAAARGDIAQSTAQTAAQALLDRQSLITQARQAIAEQMIALELLTGSLRQAWTAS